MSWHDPDRSSEPAEETALRNQLRGLLGLPARDANYFEVEPSPEMIRLADDLRREARRRSHTVRRQHSWMLATAAAVPVTLALGGLGVWGVAQERKAEQLAVALAQEEAEVKHLAAILQAPPAPPPAPAKAPAARSRAPQTLLAGKAEHQPKGKELVIPVERSVEPDVNETQQVKAP
jgi:hypothetical protein